MNNEKLVYKLNNIKFDNLEDIDIGNCLYFPLMWYKKSKFSILKRLLRIFYDLIFVDYKVIGDGKNILFYSKEYNSRKDYRDIFFKVSSAIEDNKIIIPNKKFQLKNIYLLKRIFKWYKQLKNLKDIDISLKMYILYNIIFCYVNLQCMKRELNNETKNIIVLCDFHSVDSIVVQYCNSIGIKTYTLQHGIHEKGPKYNELSYSQKFLGYGKQTKELALESGMQEDKFISVGMPQLINEKIPDKINLKNIQKIGIIFSGGKFYDEDIEMFQYAIKFARKNGYKIIIKLHPAHEDKYKINFYDYKEVEKVYAQDITVDELKKEIDFCLIDISTVFIEYTVGLFPCMLYKSRLNIYKNETDWCKFDNEIDIENFYNNLKNNPITIENKIKELRGYYTEIDNVAEKYNKAINS